MHVPSNLAIYNLKPEVEQTLREVPIDLIAKWHDNRPIPMVKYVHEHTKIGIFDSHKVCKLFFGNPGSAIADRSFFKTTTE